MSAFPDSQHICSWAGLSPGNNESAGKRKSAHINKGNPYLKSMLCEVGWVISGKRSLYLSGWYWRIKQRKGAKRATIALARKLLALIYTMLKTGSPYNEDCFEIRRKQSRAQTDQPYGERTAKSWGTLWWHQADSHCTILRPATGFGLPLFVLRWFFMRR